MAPDNIGNLANEEIAEVAAETHVTVVDGSRAKNILQLSSIEARQYLLKGESYCNFDLPDYFQFDTILSGVSRTLGDRNLSDFSVSKPGQLDDVNYQVLNNKDGRYSWRPMQLIHPAIYVSLVHKLTEAANWQTIVSRFAEFSANPKIECISLPVVSQSRKSDRAEQVLNWWHEVEQRSIELALDYECLLQTDITDCYGSIYTHSVSWALHGKDLMKLPANRGDNSYLGNVIDNHLQDMANRQTNGIPQGSAAMDFVAEIILGYADMLLSAKIGGDIQSYHIIRYRDDYRIFVNNPRDGEKIVKYLTEIMISLGLKLSAEKTKSTNQVIRGAIKGDKLYWLGQKQFEKNIQKHLLIIHNLSMLHPNSGSLVTALQDFYDRLDKLSSLDSNVIPHISIVVDIAYNNPRTYPFAAAIISLLISFLTPDDQKRIVVDKIIKKFDSIPNTGHLKIWMQRVTLGFKSPYTFDEPLCKLAAGEEVQIWNSSWLNATMQNLIRASYVISGRTIETLPDRITRDEVALFTSSFDSAP